MKNPDIIRHSMSATNFTLSSLGFHNQAFHTYSSPDDRENNTTTVEKQNVPGTENMIQGLFILMIFIAFWLKWSKYCYVQTAIIYSGVFIQRGPKTFGKSYSGHEGQTFLWSNISYWIFQLLVAFMSVTNIFTRVIEIVRYVW